MRRPGLLALSNIITLSWCLNSHLSWNSPWGGQVAHQHQHIISVIVINGTSNCQEACKKKEELVFVSFNSLSPWNIFGAQCMSNLMPLKRTKTTSDYGSDLACFLPCCCWKALRTLMTQSVFRAPLSATWHQSFFLSAPASIIMGHFTALHAHLWRLVVQLWNTMQTTNNVFFFSSLFSIWHFIIMWNNIMFCCFIYILHYWLQYAWKMEYIAVISPVVRCYIKINGLKKCIHVS